MVKITPSDGTEPVGRALRCVVSQDSQHVLCATCADHAKRHRLGETYYPLYDVRKPAVCDHCGVAIR